MTGWSYGKNDNLPLLDLVEDPTGAGSTGAGFELPPPASNRGGENQELVSLDEKGSTVFSEVREKIFKK